MASIRRIGHVRWWIAGLVFLNTVNNYVDRQVLSIVAPQLTKDLGLDNIQYGYIVQAFLVAYTAMYIGSGLLIDRYGVKLIYGAATLWWSIAAMLHGAAQSAFGLGVFRFLLGVGESANFIAAEKVAAEWYPPRERGTLNGLVQAGAVTGAIVTPPLVVWLMLMFGWRAAFVATGSLGLFWVLAWWRFYHLPERHPRVTLEELAIIREGSTPESDRHRVPWAALLRMRQTWGLLLARVVSDPVWWFYLFWLPKYLTESRGMSLTLMGLVVWVPYLASDIGAVTGGWASGRLIARGRVVLDARKRVMLGSALMMPAGLGIVWTDSHVVALALICVVLFAHMSWKTNLATLTVDLYPRSVVASAAGLVATGSGIGGALFTPLAGYLIERQSYAPVFMIMAVLHPLAYLLIRWLVTADDRAREPAKAA
jgi:ACS family hexuronate transporter-like MFS transporter